MKPSIILVNGAIGSGKDTFALELAKLLNELGDKNVKCCIDKFAYSLKSFAEEVSGIRMVEDKSMSDHFSNSTYDFTREQKEMIVPGFNITLGQFLQQLGTNAVRAWQPDFWAISLGNRIQERYDIFLRYRENMKKNGFNPKSSHTNIITDLRFPNEDWKTKERFKDTHTVITVKLLRKNNNILSTDTRDKKHASETALDNHKSDIELDNSGSIEDLVNLIKQHVVPKIT